MKKISIDKKQFKPIFSLVIAGIIAAAVILFGKLPSIGGAEKEKAESAQQGDAEGKHEGTLLKNGDFKLEVLLGEQGGEPRLRIWMYEKGKALAPTDARVTMTLVRPDSTKEAIAFSADKDNLLSSTVIAEPHVFDSTIEVRRGANFIQFSFSKEEGKVEMTDAQVTAAGITSAVAGPAGIASTTLLPGEIRFNEDRTAHVVPRVAGVVESVPAILGQWVKKGQVLAVIASQGLSQHRSDLLSAQQRLELAQSTYAREKKLWEQNISAEQDLLQARQVLHEAEIAVQNSRQQLVALGAANSSAGALNRYELRAPFDGMIVEKHISLGEAVKEDGNVFTVSDLATVWAEITVTPKDLNVVHVGQKATVKASALESQATGTISYIGSLLGEQTRSAKARVTLNNPQLSWRPGLFVNVEVASSQADVGIAVSADAVQTINDKPVVFVRIPGGFIAQVVEIGRKNEKLVEITSGLKPGARYATTGSFLLKAELGKGSADHGH